jgi:UDP-N-acetylmuramate--alanine ligase
MTHVHLIGIGGTGLSAIAMVLLESGYTVSGSDLHFSELAKSVVSAGAQFYLGHNPENVEGADIVVRSSAIPDTNVEVKAARTKAVPVLKRSEFIGQLLSDKRTIAVAGTHGKTSTTAMIAWGLIQLNTDPSFILGGVISGLGTNAKAGKGEFFVIEADEYDRMFLGLSPEIAVITNIEHDHPDCYPTADDFSEAFRQFVGRLPADGVLVACGDDPGTADIVKFAEMSGIKILTFGKKNLQNNYQATSLKPDLDQGGYEFNVRQNKSRTHVSLQVPGVHNVLNALAALVVFDLLGLSREESVLALEKFQGTGRRFEVIGKAGGVIVISDYAHHPTEIKATLAGARSRYPGRTIWAVWQPHTYSRTKLLFYDFIESFVDAHHVLVTEVYPSREPIDLDFSAGKIVDEMDHPNAVFVPKLEDTVILLSSKLTIGDILIVMSAGDADQICTQVLTNLAA